MNLTTLAQKVLHAELLRREWPDIIMPPSSTKTGLLGLNTQNEFWHNVQKLRKYTDTGSNEFTSEHTGSTGWEYASVIVFADDQVYYDEPVTEKEYNRVSSNYSLEVKTKGDLQKVEDSIILNGNVLGSKTYLDKDVAARTLNIHSGEYKVGFLCHLHSHPRIQVSGINKKIYSFFSLTDMQSFAASNYPLAGLVTDRLWLIGRTKEFMKLVRQNEVVDLGRDLIAVARAEIESDAAFNLKAAAVLSKYELAGYVSNGFSGSLQRVS